MHSQLAKAVKHKLKHPETTYKKLQKEYDVPASTINDHVKGTHSVRQGSGLRALSIGAEEVLISKINDYADRGTLLTPAHIKEIAENLAGRSLGPNWATQFIQRHKDVLSSRFRSHQEIARLRADTPECRRAFYELMKEVIDSGHYTPGNIYNMDETGFKLGDTQTRRRAGGERHGRKSQGKPTNQAHITVIATIGTSDAPVPPVLIYSGTNLQESWFQVRKDDVKQLSTITESGWINSYIAKVWIEECFDPYTRDRAGNDRRLLLLDGAEQHVKVDFLDACWDRRIVVIILPAHMSGIFQPLDVDFFNNHKSAYRKLVDNYQVASFAADISKGLFYAWHQQAWSQTATGRQIRSAWKKSGLWPLDRVVMGVEDDKNDQQPSTPPPNHSPGIIITPTTDRVLRSNNTLVRTGEIDPKEAYLKLEKAHDILENEKKVTDMQLQLLKKAMKLDKESRSSKKAVHYPHGKLLDMEYRDSHPEELDERREREREARNKRKAKKQRDEKIQVATKAAMKAIDESTPS